MNYFPGFESVQNVHPLFVHFPIALVLVALVFESMWLLTRREQFRTCATYLLYAGTVSAIATVVTGYIAADSLGHDAPGHEFVHEHRDVMVWMSGFLVVTSLAVLLLRPFREGKARGFLIVVLLGISSLLVYGADKGGRLVFELGTGVNATSDNLLLQKEEVLDAPPADASGADQHASPHEDDGHTH